MTEMTEQMPQTLHDRPLHQRRKGSELLPIDLLSEVREYSRHMVEAARRLRITQQIESRQRGRRDLHRAGIGLPILVVDGVEVVVVHHRRRVGQPRVGRSGVGAVAALGPQHPRLLLRLADVEDALAPGPVAEVLPGPVVLALAAPERHDVDAVAFGVVLDRLDEALGQRRRQDRRGHRAAVELAEEVRHAGPGLQQGHVDVEVHAVDALEGQRRMPRQDLGDATCYLHGSDSRRWAPHRPVYGQRRPRATMNAASRRRGSSGRGPFRPSSKPGHTCSSV